jgi:hypothetical protein
MVRRTRSGWCDRPSHQGTGMSVGRLALRRTGEWARRSSRAGRSARRPARRRQHRHPGLEHHAGSGQDRRGPAPGSPGALRVSVPAGWRCGHLLEGDKRAESMRRAQYGSRCAPVDGQRLPRVEGPRRLAIELVRQRPFQHVDDLLAWMRVPDQRRLRAYVHPRLDDLAAGHAKILPLQIGPPQSRRLLYPAAPMVLGRAHCRLLRFVSETRYDFSRCVTPGKRGDSPDGPVRNPARPAIAFNPKATARRRYARAVEIR